MEIASKHLPQLIIEIILRYPLHVLLSKNIVYADIFLRFDAPVFVGSDILFQNSLYILSRLRHAYFLSRQDSVPKIFQIAATSVYTVFPSLNVVFISEILFTIISPFGAGAFFHGPIMCLMSVMCGTNFFSS